jgi:hypothetical protein
MPITNGDTPLIRTDFSDDRAWQALAEAAAAPNADGFRACLAIVEDRSFEGATPEQLAEAAAGIGHDEHPLLCVDLRAARPPFRVVPGALWGVENNLALANMDYEDYADAVDADGIFRDF